MQGRTDTARRRHGRMSEPSEGECPDPIFCDAVMSEVGHSRRSDGQQGFATCPLCLQLRSQSMRRSEPTRCARTGLMHCSKRMLVVQAIHDSLCYNGITCGTQ